MVPPVVARTIEGKSPIKRRRRRTQPHLVSPTPSPNDAMRFTRATDPDLELQSDPPPEEPSDPETSPRPEVAEPSEGRVISDPSLDFGGPVGGGDTASHVAPVEMSLLPEDLTPVPSQIMGQAYALDPDEWLARADPGLDALSAARSEAAEALRWLLEEDRG